jgi:hypothetical protein
VRGSLSLPVDGDEREEAMLDFVYLLMTGGKWRTVTGSLTSPANFSTQLCADVGDGRCCRRPVKSLELTLSNSDVGFD